MGNRDRALGMNRDISRRDFINGVALVAGSLVLPMSALASKAERAQSAQSYAGMRRRYILWLPSQ